MSKQCLIADKEKVNQPFEFFSVDSYLDKLDDPTTDPVEVINELLSDVEDGFASGDIDSAIVVMEASLEVHRYRTI